MVDSFVLRVDLHAQHIPCHVGLPILVSHSTHLVFLNLIGSLEQTLVPICNVIILIVS